MIECKNVTVKKRDRVLVNDVSFCANEGEITVILGKNGSGKTTLLKCMTLNCSYEGEIYLDGENIKKFPKKQVAKRIASMVQALPKPSVSVRQLVEFGRYPYTGFSGILSDEDKKIADECIKRVEIENILFQRVDKLSGGERRKAFFAMMLCQKAEVILLDEPTANLDSEYTKHITSILLERKKEKDAVVIVLHDVNHAVEIADKIVVMDKGSMIFYGNADEFIQNKIPERVFSLEKYDCYDKDGQKKFIYK